MRRLTDARVGEVEGDHIPTVTMHTANPGVDIVPTDFYFLLFWDAFGAFGPRSDAGFMHGAWANIQCTGKKANFNTADTLVDYFPPANPGTPANA